MKNNKEDKFCKLQIKENLIGSTKYSCPKIVNLPSWDAAKKIFATATDQWIFRGQDDSGHELLPSLYRFKSCIGKISLEENLLNLFKTDVVKDYQEVKDCDPQTQFEWLCILQHYGIPTRLLDWTKCPYIASWFALYFSNINSNESCAIWAINKNWCKHHALSRIKSIKKYRTLSDNVDLSRDEYFKVLFSFHEKGDPFFVYPFEIPQRFKDKGGFERMKNQKGIFLCAGNDIDFRENLHFNSGSNSTPDEIIEQRENYIIKFVIKNKQKKEILDDLKSKEITHKYLFDSLDQYGQYVLRDTGLFDRCARKRSTKFSAEKEINNKFVGTNKSSWKQFFKDPEQLIFKDNFSLQSLLESELNTSQKMTLIDIWRDLSSY
ncbi:MAG: FRG domain-containing protein [Candidatus Omnitrophota bacterium]